MSASTRIAKVFALMGLAWSAMLPLAREAQAQGSHTGMGTMAMDRVIRAFMLADQLEMQPGAVGRPVKLEFVGWIGDDYRRLLLRADGEQPTAGPGRGELQADVLYGRLVTPFWTAVGGVRVDTRPRVFSRLRSPDLRAGGGLPGARLTRGMLALGFEGLAPGWLSMEPTLLVSSAGDVSLELESTLDLLLTQRLIVQPRVELNAAVQEVAEIGVGSGLNDIGLGLRLRYEIHRKFAPYVGASWLRRTGATAAMAHDAGERTGVGTVSAGVRLWR